MMKRIALLFAIVAACLNAQAQQTMWVCTGQVKYAYNTAELGNMPYLNGTTLTILDKVFNIADIDSIYVNSETFDDDNILVNYATNKAYVTVAGNIASHITPVVTNAHVSVVQDTTVATEYTYTLQGTSIMGSFYQDGSYKITVRLNDLTLNNPDSAAINIRDGKRIAVELVDGTTTTLSDGTNGPQKGCFAVKGHAEFKGSGTLNITGNTKNAFWGKEYVEIKKTVGAINILGAVGDGFNVNQYFLQNGGVITINNVGDDGIQVSYETDDNDVIIEDEENTGAITLKGGTLNINMTSDGGKGVKAASDVNISGTSLTVVQSGNYVYDGVDPSYCAAVKADGNINVTGGTVNVTSTAAGGRGLNADGTINIDESSATTNIDIKANGAGGVLATNSSGSGETPKSYRLYVAKPSGYSNWNNSNVYLYKSDGTLVANITSNTVQRSSGSTTLTFYYYDFGSANSDTYYIGGTYSYYTLKTVTFTGPTSGEDLYYQISSSYSSSGSTRTFSMTNVTSQYGGSSEQGEDSGESYNASGIKADGNVTIGGGTITIANSGAMSKSIKSKATCTINGGNLTLKPSGAMQVISNDASYSSGIKAVDFVMNDGTLGITATGTAGKGISTTTMTTNGGTITVTNSGAAQAASTSGDYYTAKGFKTDGDMNLLGGTITITMTGKGGKGIKVNGNYVQGNADTTGPTLTVSTTGTAAGTSSSGGWGPGGGSSVSGSAKGVKVEGTITINGGTAKVSATGGEGSEGIESKTTMTINGGYIECNTYDDALNSAGHMYIKGGFIYAVATNNDAIDSNGNMYLSGGMVFCYGSEEGLDANSEGGYKVYIQSGANLAAIGRSMGAIESGASLSQSCYQTTASSNTWYALYNGNTVVAAFQVPTLSSGGGGYGPGGGSSGGSTMVVTSPSCKLYSGVTGSGTSFWSGKGYSNASGGSNVSLSSYSGGGGGW